MGKTTLAKRLAESFNYQTLLERRRGQSLPGALLPAIGGRRRWPPSFSSCSSARSRSRTCARTDIFEPVRVADFLIEKDPLFARINLDADEYQLYEKVFQQMTIDAPRPDLVIYLQASTDVSC